MLTTPGSTHHTALIKHCIPPHTPTWFPHPVLQMIGVDDAADHVVDGVHAAGAGDGVHATGDDVHAAGDGVHAAGDGAPAAATIATSRHRQSTHRLIHALHLAIPEFGIIISRQIPLIKSWPN